MSESNCRPGRRRAPKTLPDRGPIELGETVRAAARAGYAGPPRPLAKCGHDPARAYLLVTLRGALAEAVRS